MTFAVLRALHTIIGDALNGYEIECVYSAHGQSLEVIRVLLRLWNDEEVKAGFVALLWVAKPTST